MMWGVLVIAAVATLLLAAVVIGGVRWRRATRVLQLRLEAGSVPIEPAVVDLGALDGLPPPVARFLRCVLRHGQPMVTGVRMRHRGTLNLGATTDRWRPFTSAQRVVIRPPGFDWDARVALLPGLTVRVRDAYVAGEGILHGALLGLVPVVDQRGAGALAEGELMRWLAEAAWYPTALLPGQGVSWEPIDDVSARATVSDGAVTTRLVFHFDQRGRIERVEAANRGRSVGEVLVPTPWQGRFWDYQLRDGMQVPIAAEVAWLLPDGARPYWRGQIEEVRYDLAE